MEASILRNFLCKPGGDVLDDRVKQRVPFRLLQFHLRYYFFFRPAHCAYMSTIQVMLVV